MVLFQKRPFRAVKAVLFDMDGTLIDSMGAYYGIIRDILEQLNIEITLSRELLFQSLSRGEILSNVVFAPEIRHQKNVVQQFNTLALEAFRAMFSKGDVMLIHGVGPLLEELKRRGFLLAIVTSSRAEIVVPFLKAKNIHPHLSCVIGRFEAPRLKPSPDPILTCMEMLDVHRSEAVYVGDSIIDIQAGKAAGTGTVGVLTGTSDMESLKAEVPDAILDSVGDLLTLL
jgi:HAD superfamily hydrolase (TIGR01509 family)